MKLTYWYSERIDDSNCYSIRARTKRACLAERNEQADSPGAGPNEVAASSTGYGAFGPVVKVTIEYRDGFDLAAQLLGDEGGLESYLASKS